MILCRVYGFGLFWYLVTVKFDTFSILHGHVLLFSVNNNWFGVIYNEDGIYSCVVGKYHAANSNQLYNPYLPVSSGK